MSTHTLQPLIWLTRRWISACVTSGTVPDLVALLSASSAFIASGSTITGWIIRACIMSSCCHIRPVRAGQGVNPQIEGM